jgi:excisionase family DNA binding protein
MSTHAIFSASAMSQTPQSIWLTATEAAQYLKVKPRTLLQWARQGKVPAHRLSGTKRCVWRFLKSELDAMLLPSLALAA